MSATSWGWEPATVTAGSLPSGIDAAKVADGSVSSAEYQRLDGVTAAVQTQLDAKLPKAGGQITGNITCASAETFDGRDLSIDGAKLDGIASGATNTPLSNATPAALGTASAGVSTSAARGDHVHASPSPGIVIPFQTVYVTASRWITGLDTQYGSVSSGTGTRTDGYHLFLPANTTWRLEMVTSYSYGGGGQLRFSVETASAWGGTYSEAAFVTTTSGGINTVFTTTLTVGASGVVAVFNCRHATSGINNVICRFFQVG